MRAIRAELENWLLHGQIDLLVGFSPIELDIAETIDILQERLLVAVPQIYLKKLFPNNFDDKIREFEISINLEAFKSCPFLLVTSGNRIRTLFNHYIKQRGIQLNIALEMESIETLLALACEGMGITIYPEMFANHLSPLVHRNPEFPVHMFPLDDPSTNGHLVLAYHRGQVPVRNG